MRRRAALGFLATLRFGMSFGHASAATSAEVLADAEFSDEQGAPHRLNELTRPLLLVNLWAAWCAGCREELPTIRTMASRLGPDAIDVVLLSHELYWRGDLAYAREARLPFRHWKLSSRVAKTAVTAVFQVEDDRFGLPRSLVFAGRGRTLVASHLGSRDWAAPAQIRQAQGWVDAAG